ncbi:proline iminopeptidase [Crassisporium funariophilum]|nr:proline iminopeptidase [Crassisporium funariophilum]
MFSTSSFTTIESEVPLHVPSIAKPCKTWYRVFGDLKSGNRPLIALHGGPGCSSDYLYVLSDLTAANGTPVVVYDQLGNGRSTHLPEKKGDTTFWTEQLFLDELDNLLTHLGIQNDYDLLGHSWGGMLAARHAVSKPAGLKHLIIASSPSGMRLWVEEQNRLRTYLPQDVQAALNKHEEAGTTDSKEYEEAVAVFYDRHLCRLKPMPSDVVAVLDWIAKDPTVYHTMNGPSEFHVIGSLKDWTITNDAHKIEASLRMTNGRYDEATDNVLFPMFKAIPHVKWVQFSDSSHMPHQEERGRYMIVVAEFLAN